MTKRGWEWEQADWLPGYLSDAGERIVYTGATGVTLKRSEYNTQPMSGLSDRLVVKSEKRRGIKVTPRLLI